MCENAELRQSLSGCGLCHGRGSRGPMLSCQAILYPPVATLSRVSAHSHRREQAYSKLGTGVVVLW